MQFNAAFSCRPSAILRSFALMIILSAAALAASTAIAEILPPLTTPSPIMGTYGTTQNVALTCSDSGGSGCTATYYCVGTGCTPTTPYTGPVSIAATTSLSFYSTDLDGNSEQARTYVYAVDTTVPYRFERLWPQLPQPWHFGGSAFAFDTNGNVYAADSTFSRITKFDANGFFVTSWGSYGSGNGQFKNPYGIAVDSAGNVYVADTNNCRIQKFTTNGVFLTTWGANGSGNAQFQWPNGVTVDPAGNVYVADTSNYRIQKFASNGAFITKWGSYGAAAGQFNSPVGILADPAGNVYVADTSNNRIQKFGSSGAFISTWGSSGSANGQFNTPRSIAVDSAGNVYVADTNNNRVQKFTSEGTFITKWSPASGGSLPFGIAINPGGTVYISAGQIQKFTSSGAFLSSLATSGNATGQFNGPSGIAADTAGNVYVADNYNHRIQKFDSAGNHLSTWGGTFGNGNGQFKYPNGIAIDATGNVYVADTSNHRVQKFTSTGAFLAAWGTSGSANGQFSSPWGVAVNATGDIYVADSSNHRVQKLSADGTFVAAWGASGSGNGQFSYPKGIAVDSLGNVYVTDSSNNRIQKFDANGTFVTAWGSSGNGTGQFSSPYGVSVDSTDNIYVADYANSRLQKFTSAGTFVSVWGTKGNESGQVNNPQGISVDPSGNVYITDTNNHRIQKFLPDTAPNTPGAPIAITATAGNSQASVAFTAPSTNGGSAITSYTATSNPDNLTATGTASPLTISGLTNGTPYTFAVTASNANGTGPASAPSNSITPGLTTYSLSLAVTGTGTIHSTPAPDINCSGSCSQAYESSTVVTLTAPPGSGYTFSGWAGACSGNSSCTVTMSQARSVSATFTYALPGAPTSVTATAGNGQATVSFTAPAFNGGSPITSYTVASSPGTITASGSASPITVTGLTNGTAYTFTVTATNANGTGTTSGLSNSVTPNVTSYALSLTVTGSGTVHSTPAPDIACSGSCGQSYAGGTSVTLTASPGSDYTFTAWSGACSGTGSCSVTMSQARTVTANFTAGVNGVCGSANNGTFATPPTMNLCSLGTASNPTGVGPWEWSCSGTNGGIPAYCSTARGGGITYRSDDDGVTWTPGQTEFGFGHWVYSMAASPAYGSDHTLFMGIDYGIYKSSDNGATWALTRYTSYAKDIAFSPAYASDRTVFAGAWGDGIYKSTDGGTTWNTINSGLANQSVNAIALSPSYGSDHTLFAALYSQGVYKSTDNGATWVPANTGIENFTAVSLALSPAYASDRTLFAATTDGLYSGGGPYYHVYKSVDAGSSWNLADSGLSGSITKLVISSAFASDQTLFAVTGSGAYKSVNGGTFWTQVNGTTAGTSIAISPAYTTDRTLFLSISGDDVYRSSDGGSSWSPANSGFVSGNRRFTALAISPNFASDRAVFTASTPYGPNMERPLSLSFGDAITGNAPIHRQLTIANNNLPFADSNLEIRSLTLSGTGSSQFGIAPGSCGSLTPVIAVGASCSFDITFTPTTSGSKSATVQISSNNKSYATDDVTLSGTGVSVASTITSPASGFFTNGASLTVAGTATCSGCTISMVHVSIDNGATWLAASGTTSWSASIPTVAAGTYTIRSRAWSNAGFETPGSGISVAVERTPPTGTLALYNGVWTLNADSRDGQMCLMVYPNICGTMEMSPNGFSGWQPATMTPGTSGPLWLRDRAGNVSAMISGTLSNNNGGPIRIDGGTYYSFLQHALNAAGNGTVLKLTSTRFSETLLATANSSYTVRGGYDSSHNSVTGTTPLSGDLTIQAGTLTVENLDVTGSVNVAGGAVTANTISIQ